MTEPLHTISAGGQHHGLVTAFMERQFGASVGQPLDEPAPTVTAGGGVKALSYRSGYPQSMRKAHCASPLS